MAETVLFGVLQSAGLEPATRFIRYRDGGADLEPFDADRLDAALRANIGRIEASCVWFQAAKRYFQTQIGSAELTSLYGKHGAALWKRLWRSALVVVGQSAVDIETISATAQPIKDAYDAANTGLEWSDVGIARELRNEHVVASIAARIDRAWASPRPPFQHVLVEPAMDTLPPRPLGERGGPGGSAESSTNAAQARRLALLGMLTSSSRRIEQDPPKVREAWSALTAAPLDERTVRGLWRVGLTRWAAPRKPDVRGGGAVAAAPLDRPIGVRAAWMVKNSPVSEIPSRTALERLAEQSAHPLGVEGSAVASALGLVLEIAVRIPAALDTHAPYDASSTGIDAVLQHARVLERMKLDDTSDAGQRSIAEYFRSPEFSDDLVAVLWSRLTRSAIGGFPTTSAVEVWRAVFDALLSAVEDGARRAGPIEWGPGGQRGGSIAWDPVDVPSDEEGPDESFVREVHDFVDRLREGEQPQWEQFERAVVRRRAADARVKEEYRPLWEEWWLDRAGQPSAPSAKPDYDRAVAMLRDVWRMRTDAVRRGVRDPRAEKWRTDD